MGVEAERMHWKGAKRGKVEVISHYEYVNNNEEIVTKVSRSHRE